ncbi:MAG: cation diffusion facilitator family transporter [Proteobacteria bacterium]|nr:cation diffusion facilitator family transporter [Pseudomonadota bacterium]
MAPPSDISTREGRRVTLVGAVVNVVLTVLKFAGGYFYHSQALIADAMHSLSDLFTDFVALFGLAAGGKAPDRDHPFGHARIETLASTIIGLTLLFVAVEIASGALDAIARNEPSAPSWMAVAIAAVSIIFKEALYQYTAYVGRRFKSPVLRANAWHHRSDAMSSVAVLLGVTGAQIKPEWRILDAYAALLVSIFVLKVGLDVILNSVRELTDTAPGPEVLDSIHACARSVEGVLETHDLKVRSTGGMYQMELHVVVDGELTVSQGHMIAKEVERCVLDEIEEAVRVIVHVDPDSETGPEGDGRPVTPR